MPTFVLIVREVTTKSKIVVEELDGDQPSAERRLRQMWNEFRQTNNPRNHRAEIKLLGHRRPIFVMS